MKLAGIEAIEYAKANGLTLSKYTDPTEAAREGLTPDEARKIAREDPSLIYLPNTEMKLTETKTFAGWGIIGEPQDGVIIAGPSGDSIDVTGYSASYYWDGDEFLGQDIFGIVPIYQTDAGQFPPEAVPYPYLA